MRSLLGEINDRGPTVYRVGTGQWSSTEQNKMVHGFANDHQGSILSMRNLEFLNCINYVG